MKTATAFFFSILLLLVACEPETIGTTETKTAVVTGYLFAGQPCDSIRIVQSISYGSEDTVAVTLDDLVVTLSDGATTFTLTPAGAGYYRNPDLIIESGKNYLLQFEHNGKAVSAQTFVPEKREAALSDTLIEMEKIEAGTFPPIGGGTMPEPIEATWDNSEGDYYYVVVQNLEDDPEYINEFFAGQDSLFRNFRFISEPQATDFYNIDPQREIWQFGKHRVIVFRVNPEYAALYNVSASSSLSITEPPGNVENGLGILTGAASDTLFFVVKKQ
ncbi:MAG: DUF4249 family protein [Bacteroidota bacterium]